MSWVIVGVLGGGLLSAGGSIGGSAIASKGGGVGQRQLKETPAAGFNAFADPLANSLVMSLLQGLGQPTSLLADRSSPLAQLQNAASSGSIGLVNQNNMAQLNTGLQIIQGIMAGELPSPQKTGGRRTYEDKRDARGNLVPAVLPEDFDPRTASDEEIEAQIRRFLPGESRAMLEAAASSMGMSGISDLIKRERQFNRQVAETQPTLDQISKNQLEARSLGSQQFLDVLRDFPRGTQDDINRISQVERDRSREALLQQANVAGVNPAAGLAELERDPGPIARAVALLGGQQSLALNQLGAANQALFGPVELAIGGSSPLLAAAQGQGSLAAQQASTIAQFGTANANPNTLGTGVAAGLGGLGNTLSMLGIMGSLNSGGAGASGSGGGSGGGGTII